MTISDRDRRALTLLAGAVAVTAIVWFWPQPSVEVVGAPANDAASAALQLDRARAEAALVNVREQSLAAARADLARLEKGLIAAETLPQAQAQLVQIVRRVARAQAPAPVEVRSTEFGSARPYGDSYAEILLAANFECQIDQLVNLLSDLAAQPELLAVDELHISAKNDKQKSMTVRLTVAGLARGSLLRKVGA
ncbi:MAG: type II secretion system protein GspM [Bryobacteraceae bacterium]|nr:type II secretion system protein GspM [Bryobacteraceae bacterium]